jgi:hypothetical protein
MRARRWSLLCGLLLLVAPVRGQEPPAAGARFAWPVPCQLEAIETNHKAGKVGKQRHQVRLWSDPGSGELRAQIQDSQLLEFAGRDFTRPENADEGAALMRQVSFPYPVWRVGPDGGFQGAIDLEGTVERWLEMLMQVAPPDRKAALTRLHEELRSPATMASSLQAMRDTWDAWCGAWVGAPLTPGARRETRRAEDHKGTTLEAPCELEVLEPRPGGAALRLRRTVRFESEAARAALAAYLERIVPPGAPRPVVKEYRASTVLEAETDPTTLLPASAALVRRETIVLAEGAPREKEERREWTFRRVEARGE